jgi:hypothetical protein
MRQLPFGHHPSAWRFHGVAGGPIGRPPVLPESSSCGGSMARGRAAALDPWHDWRVAVGLRRRGESEVAALRCIGRARLYEDGGGSMARGRAAALDPWRDGRAAGGPVATAR